MKLIKTLAAFTLALTLSAAAQTTDAKPTETPAKQPSKSAEMEAKMADARVQTFYLTNASQQTEGSEIVVALRNILPPYIKIYFVADQNAVVVDAAPDQLALAQQLIKELDRPRKTYRLTYTLTEVDGAKRIGTQHFSMVVVTGQRTTLKQGSKIPVITGSYSPSNASAGTQNQFTYIDVGMNFAAQLDETEHGARLNSKVEQSSVGEEKAIADAQEPVIRQTVLEGTSFLTLNQPLMLGSLDILGTTRHLDIEVTMEKVQ